MSESIELRIFGDRAPTADQRPAVFAPAEGRIVVDAGAGTGKTTTLEMRARYLIASGTVAAGELLVVTFTRKAAAEIGERIIRTLDEARDRIAGDPHGVTCCTIHALAARVLAEFAYVCGLDAPPRPIADGEARALFDEVLDEAFAGRLDAPTDALPIVEVKPDTLRASLAALVLRLKQAGIDPDDFERRGLQAARALAAQSWGQLWRMGTRGKAVDANPKPERTPHERAVESEREAKNVRFVAAAYRRFDERLRESGASTYGDLLTLATRLLREHPHAGEALRRRWRYVLVDEFQDTAPAQLAFLREIFGDPDHPERELANVTAVGDFRQSIYGFNGADAEIMRALAREAHAVHPLTENRRSRTQIVEAAHAAIAARLGSAAVGTAMSAVRGDSETPCVFARTAGTPGDPIADRIEAEAAAIAAEIARLCAQGTDAGDIAVLLRKRTHAHRYVRALARRGIPVALDRRASLLEMPEIRDVRAWLRLLVEFDKPDALALAIVRVLQSPQLGFDAAGLAQLAVHAGYDWAAVALDGIADDRLDAVARERLERLRAWLEEALPARCEPATLAVRRLFATVPLAASYADDPQAEQRLANLREFETLAQHFAADAVDPRLPQFVRFCERCVDFEENVEEADLDCDGVAVMTVHQAKGLQWPVVFVPGVDTFHYGNRQTNSPFRYDERHGALVLNRDVDDRFTLRNEMAKVPYDPATGEYVKDDPRKTARLDEEARILYVAMTRAEDRLYLSCPSPDNAHEGYAAVAARAQAWPDAGETERAAAAGAGVRPPRIVAYEAPQRPPDDVLAPVLSFTALAAYRDCPRLARYRYRLRFPQVDGPRERAKGESNGEFHADAATFGAFVHRALERWGRSRIDGEPIDAAAAVDSVIAEYEEVDEAQRARATRLVEQAIATLARLTVLDVEARFEHPVGDVVLTGAIDLVARDEHGTVHVVDYKTGTLVADDHYALQLELYARALQRRYAGATMRSRILRLSESGAEWRDPAPPQSDELERLVREAGSFTSDEPRPGAHCATCPYNGSPCGAGAGG